MAQRQHFPHQEEDPKQGELHPHNTLFAVMNSYQSEGETEGVEHQTTHFAMVEETKLSLQLSDKDKDDEVWRQSVSHLQRRLDIAYQEIDRLNNELEEMQIADQFT